MVIISFLLMTIFLCICLWRREYRTYSLEFQLFPAYSLTFSLHWECLAAVKALNNKAEQIEGHILCISLLKKRMQKPGIPPRLLQIQKIFLYFVASYVLI